MMADVTAKRDPRSRVLLTARLKTETGETDVRVRNLSAHGAMIEDPSGRPPQRGGKGTFVRGDVAMTYTVAWVQSARYGIRFDREVEASELLVHINRTADASAPRETVFRRPGLNESRVSDHDRKIASDWAKRPGSNHYGE